MTIGPEADDQDAVEVGRLGNVLLYCCYYLLTKNGSC